MFSLLLRVHSILLQLETIQEASGRTPCDEELSMMRMELQSEASGIKVDMMDAELFQQKYNKGYPERVVLGNEFCRDALMTMIHGSILETSNRQAWLEQTVTSMIGQGERCRECCDCRQL